MFKGKFKAGHWYKVSSKSVLRRVCIQTGGKVTDYLYTLGGSTSINITKKMLQYAGKWIQALRVDTNSDRVEYNGDYIQSTGYWHWYREMLCNESRTTKPIDDN